jgi:hypothetical protein
MLILPSAASIVFQAILPGTGGSGAKLDIAYLEFVNGPTVTPPDIYPEESPEYYDRLEATPDRDYLQCKVLSHKTQQSMLGRTVLSVVVVSEGDAGVHGKPFSAMAGSRVYGIALAASQSNHRDDILFMRRGWIDFFLKYAKIRRCGRGLRSWQTRPASYSGKSRFKTCVPPARRTWRIVIPAMSARHGWGIRKAWRISITGKSPTRILKKRRESNARKIVPLT